MENALRKVDKEETFWVRDHNLTGGPGLDGSAREGSCLDPRVCEGPSSYLWSKGCTNFRQHITREPEMSLQNRSATAITICIHLCG